jgi:hypothetical protein
MRNIYKAPHSEEAFSNTNTNAEIFSDLFTIVLPVSGMQQVHGKYLQN